MASVFASFFSSHGQENFTKGNIFLCTFAAVAAGNTPFVEDLYSKLPKPNLLQFQNSNDFVSDIPKFTAWYFAVIYEPAPNVKEITITYEGRTNTLERTLMHFANTHLPRYNYKSERFYTKLDPKYIANTIGDWLTQTGYQHQFVNYANALRVELPVVSLAIPIMKSV